jgi:hypothetical protein
VGVWWMRHFGVFMVRVKGRCGCVVGVVFRCIKGES